MEWVESTGNTVEEAKDVALDRLGVHEDDAEFEIVNEAKTGLFGRVKEEARVRARVRPSTPRAKEDRRRQRGGRRRSRGGGGRDHANESATAGSGGDAGERTGEGGQKRGGGRGGQNGGRGGGGGGQNGGRRQGGRNQDDRTRDGRSRDAGRAGGDRGGRDTEPGDGAAGRTGEGDNKEHTVNEEPTMPLSEQADIAQEFVAGLAERFGAAVDFERADVDADIHLTVTGNDLGRMIGRRGATALAIDELVRTVLQRQAGSSRDGRIRVDIGGVRARRTEALTAFTRTLASEVRESGVARALEPMGAADRKVVHDVITDEAGVDSISEGEDPDRRVVIVPIEDAD